MRFKDKFKWHVFFATVGIRLTENPGDGMGEQLYHTGKRILDIFLSLTAIVLLSPIFVVVSILIYLQKDGPVLFRQERLGQYGKVFEIYKFRSMHMDSPNLASAKIRSDQYVTGLGRFLRSTSIDELPQVFNILKGEMSFVGPRPFIREEGPINVERVKHGIDQLKPGLTGWAQIMARDTADQEHKIALDLYYKEHQCMMLDIKIIFLTIFKIKGL